MQVKGILLWLKKRPGFVILGIVLTAITFSIIKPDFYLMGWDNFSSYLNPKQNIFNTFFSTWREHRGLGVPSDAESNDLFRQFFCLITSFFFGMQLADQIYMAFTLWGGVLGMYFLGRFIAHQLHDHAITIELFGFIAAFFYLFNLSTLSVYYFPMIMYNTRFFMLPTTVLVLLKLVFSPKLSRTYFLFYCSLVLIGFGAFMVPTIYIVFMMGVGLLPFFTRKYIQTTKIIALFILLGAYWILPFTNYTIQKSAVVPEAPTFVEINESMLNKSKSFYSFERQAKMRPSFFESEFTNNASQNKATPFHELARQDESGIYRILFWIFPLLYLGGILYNLVITRHKLVGWFSAITFLFLILSMKEYSLFGVLYGFISDHVPFANTIFRFGDTKFHAMIAFGGSICAAFLISSLFQLIKKRAFFNYLALGMTVALLLFYISGFKTYFNGNFIGFFMYNKLPEAYWDISKTINSDPESIRVVQLPFDTHTYWKPYSWGYFGSSFLHFMLNKPLFDRTFEPASKEGAELHRQMINLYHEAASVTDENNLKDRALSFHRLFSSLSIKYIIDDQTISTNIDARNIAYWGTIAPLNSHKLLNYMQQVGLIELVKEYSISSSEYAKDYAKLYPYNNTKNSFPYVPRSIYLYKLTDTEPQISFVGKLDIVNSGHSERLTPQVSSQLENHYIQSPQFDQNAIVFPFDTTKKAKIQVSQDTISISSPIRLASGFYTLQTNDIPSNSTQIVDVFAQTKKGAVTILFNDVVSPTIVGSVKLNPQTYSQIDIQTTRVDYNFLSINDSQLPLSYSNNSQTRFLGTVILRGDQSKIELLYPEDVYNVSSMLRQTENNPQCLGDAFENPDSHIEGENGVLQITGKNVSTCFTSEVPLNKNKNTLSQMRLEFNASGIARDLSLSKEIDSGKPQLYKEIRELHNPLILYVCVKPEGSSSCTNKETIHQITDTDKPYIVTLFGNFTNINKMIVTYTIRSSQRQSYEASISNIILRTYSNSKDQFIDKFNPSPIIEKYSIDSDKPMVLEIPKAKSTYSHTFVSQEAVLVGKDPSCDGVGKYQTTKMGPSGLISYIVGCKNYFNKNTTFSSNNFYLWDVEYSHLSGAMPTFIVMDKYSTYSYNKLYPSSTHVNDYFSTLLQKPESALLNRSSLTDSLSIKKPYSINGYMNPEPELENNGDKEFIIEHYTQNEGVSEIQNISFIELPNYWANSILKKDEYQPLQADKPIIISSHRILPSLAEVQINSNGNEHLLVFNEQYDRQWILIGAQSYKHFVCDGVINCYQVTVKPGITTLYLLYYPELFGFIGISITLLSILLGFKMLHKKVN